MKGFFSSGGPGGMCIVWLMFPIILDKTELSIVVCKTGWHSFKKGTFKFLLCSIWI